MRRRRKARKMKEIKEARRRIKMKNFFNSPELDEKAEKKRNSRGEEKRNEKIKRQRD